MDEQIPWYRIFGLALINFFQGQPVAVELELDLSIKKQLLDVLIIRKERSTLSRQLPDGFEELAHYNLITFKSHQQSLSVWSLQELLGHYVNLRKQVSPSMDESDLLPQDDFRLFAVCVRFPRELASRIALEQVQAGMYDIEGLGSRIRIVAINQLPPEQQNAMLHLFSTRVELWRYAVEHYPIQSDDTSSLIYYLYKRMTKEMPNMPDVLKEFTANTIKQMLKELPIEERLEGLSPEERLKGLTPEECFKGLSKEQREAMLRLFIQEKGSSQP